MNLLKDKYIIVEVIPTSSDSKKGIIAQLSALKLDRIKLIDRFDYRVDEKLVNNKDLYQLQVGNMTIEFKYSENDKDLLEMISYDKDNFKYTDNPDLILSEFKKWNGDLPIMLIEKDYTKEYLASLNNKMELVYPYLEVEYNYDVFNTIMNKYQIEASNYLVDIIYEAIILESNNEKVNNE